MLRHQLLFVWPNMLPQQYLLSVWPNMLRRAFAGSLLSESPGMLRQQLLYTIPAMRQRSLPGWSFAGAT